MGRTNSGAELPVFDLTNFQGKDHHIVNDSEAPVPKKHGKH